MINRELDRNNCKVLSFRKKIKKIVEKIRKKSIFGNNNNRG